MKLVNKIQKIICVLRKIGWFGSEIHTEIKATIKCLKDAKELLITKKLNKTQKKNLKDGLVKIFEIADSNIKMNQKRLSNAN